MPRVIEAFATIFAPLCHQLQVDLFIVLLQQSCRARLVVAALLLAFEHFGLAVDPIEVIFDAILFGMLKVTTGTVKVRLLVFSKSSYEIANMVAHRYLSLKCRSTVWTLNWSHWTKLDVQDLAAMLVQDVTMDLFWSHHVSAIVALSVWQGLPFRSKHLLQRGLLVSLLDVRLDILEREEFSTVVALGFIEGALIRWTKMVSDSAADLVIFFQMLRELPL